MALWKIGVSSFIPNNSFKWGTKVYALLSSAVGTGVSVLPYDNDYGTDQGMTQGRLIQYLRAGDRVLIGPSTHADYYGATENLVVASVTTTQITLSSTTSAAYSDNDTISAIGTNCPGGWLPNNDSNFVMGGITDHDLWTLSDTEGKLDRFSVQFKNTGEASSRALKYTINELYFLVGIYYRAGCYYQFDENTVASVYAHLNANSTNFINETIASADTSGWTEYNSAAAQSPGTMGSGFYIEFGITDTTGEGTANIDCVYAEHASGTDDSADGVYTFDDYPSYGSRKFSTVRGTSMSRLKNSRLILNDSTGGGDKNKKYIVSASFKDSPKAIRENLEILMDWQDRGWYLVLHHDIPEVPPNLQGLLIIKDTGLTNWDSNKCSFNLSFEEA